MSAEIARRLGLAEASSLQPWMPEQKEHLKSEIRLGQTRAPLPRQKSVVPSLKRFLRRLACQSFLLLVLLASPNGLRSQNSATYHLHQEPSSTSGLFQIKTTGPDTASVAIQSADLKNQPAGEYLVKAFDTSVGMPNLSGSIPSGSTVTFTLWMKKTANFGTMFPRAKLHLNSPTGPSFCQSTGASALRHTSVASFTLSCATGSQIAVSSSDRFYLWVGINMTAGPGNKSVKAELDVEGTLNGNYDSRVVVPMPNMSPTVSITSPTNNASFTAGADITIDASASDTDGTITKVEFFQGTIKLGEDLTSPYSFVWNNVSAGNYSLNAKATDNRGGSGVSSAVNINVSSPNIPPAVSITSPTANMTFVAPATVVIDASASDSDGTITVVEFFQGTTLLGEDTTSPFSFTWANVSPGIYSLAAKATDNLNATTTSSPVDISVANLSPLDPTTPNKEYIYQGDRLIATEFGKPDGDIAPSESGTVTIVSPGTQPGKVTFTGTAGQRIAYLANAVTGDPGVVVVVFMLAPDDSVVVGGYGLGANQSYFSDQRTLTMNGTYTIWAVPQGGLQGGLTLTVYSVPPDTAQTTVPSGQGGTVVVPSTTVPGQNAKITFTGTAGQRIAYFANSVTGDPGVAVVLYMSAPDGSVVVSGYAILANQTFFSNAYTLPQNGTYTLWVDPRHEQRGGVTMTTYLVPADTVQSITPTPGGTPVIVPTTTVPGQNAAVTFQGTANQQVTTVINSVTGDPGVCVVVFLTNPDGSANGFGFGVCAGGSGSLGQKTLPTNGTYTIWVDPRDEKRGGASLTVSSP